MLWVRLERGKKERGREGEGEGVGERLICHFFFAKFLALDKEKKKIFSLFKSKFQKLFRPSSKGKWKKFLNTK